MTPTNTAFIEKVAELAKQEADVFAQDRAIEILGFITFQLVTGEPYAAWNKVWECAAKGKKGSESSGFWFKVHEGMQDKSLFE